eukprot:14324353-Alexandrium_andersonii.AAC.1
MGCRREQQQTPMSQKRHAKPAESAKDSVNLAAFSPWQATSCQIEFGEATSPGCKCSGKSLLHGLSAAKRQHADRTAKYA